MHYADEELEEVRRALVRLSIARNPTGKPAWLASDRDQFLRWVKWLRSPGKA
jgi:hypothetical protein